MGCDVTGNVFVGVRVDRSMFWTTIGKARKCLAGHAGKGKYCSECGGRLETVDEESPTPFFVEIAKAKKIRPKKLWDNWIEDPDFDEFGLIPVGVVQSSEDDEESPLAVGMRVLTMEEEGGSSIEIDEDSLTSRDVAALSVERLLAVVERVRKQAELWGISGDVKIFGTLDAGY